MNFYLPCQSNVGKPGVPAGVLRMGVNPTLHDPHKVKHIVQPLILTHSLSLLSSTLFDDQSKEAIMKELRKKVGEVGNSQTDCMRLIRSSSPLASTAQKSTPTSLRSSATTASAPLFSSNATFTTLHSCKSFAWTCKRLPRMPATPSRSSSV